MNALMQIGVPYVIVNKLDKSTEVSGNLQGLFSWGVFLGGVFITLITFKSQLKVVKNIFLKFWSVSYFRNMFKILFNKYNNYFCNI